MNALHATVVESIYTKNINYRRLIAIASSFHLTANQTMEDHRKPREISSEPTEAAGDRPSPPHGGKTPTARTHPSCPKIRPRDASAARRNLLRCCYRADSIGSKIMCYDNKDLIFSPYNAHWRQMRKICVSELLNARNVKSLGFIREDEMSRLVQFLRSSAGEAVNMTEKITATTSSIICRAAFGSVVKDGDVLIELVKTTSGMANGFELADLFPSSKLLNLLCLKFEQIQVVEDAPRVGRHS
ncbi:hypothetical protein C2S53_000113 [Perilla frutescens var. hirtella]|uniref:Cytochrome P450 n=1 Tax=Perilla frutescens var. hirtella TaxID=608512 RepID=A0AAD4IYY4_PERFH|nr:hypothetical protein C2S53_000113 [Perilla frutescens var. hirtella]